MLGHADLGQTELNGDVWVHRDFAYVGTWRDPCNGRGVKVIDVADLRSPKPAGTLAARAGTSAEDIVVRRVSTAFFSGDLLAVGIQRCGEDAALDDQKFGFELWDVSDPRDPHKLSEFATSNGDAGVHELDLFQRGERVYALVAVPDSEWLDPVPAGDFRVIDVTDPRAPFKVSDWGAGAHGLSIGPWWGFGSFGSIFAHSARASDDGQRAYVSYWDLGVLTFDISDPAHPAQVARTTYQSGEEGNAHSMTPLRAHGRDYILQNDEDEEAPEIDTIRFGSGGKGSATENSPGATPLWLQPGHRLHARVVDTARHGCEASDYPTQTRGRIAVVRTPLTEFDPPGGEEPMCEQAVQEKAAQAAGARAVVHDFISERTSPQWFDYDHVDIPALFTDHRTARGMVAAGRATLVAARPAWGYLRIYDQATGKQLAEFDDLPYVRDIGPEGDWSIHNTEILGDRAYSSWYTHGIVALNLDPLTDDRDDPELVGQFVPATPAPEVWGVYVRATDKVVFASDMPTGLWIVKPTGRAAPNG